MAELHLWLQAKSDQGGRILVRVEEGVDKVERSTPVVDCMEADFGTFETALCRILHKTTINEPLRMVQQVQGQRGFEAWHMIVRTELRWSFSVSHHSRHHLDNIKCLLIVVESVTRLRSLSNSGVALAALVALIDMMSPVDRRIRMFLALIM